MKKEQITFKKGIYKLNEQENFNFQLNRVIMWDGGDLKDIEKIASKITSSKSWKKEMLEIAAKAEQEDRIENAIAYYRMSEFFMYDGDPDKEKYYNLATDMFYEYYKEYFEDGTVIRYKVPYEEVQLPVMFTKAKGLAKDTVLLHGGNDSYFEEFFFCMLYLAEQGFDVYLFEGPGQGGVMRVQGKHFTYEWEKPVTVIMDALNLNDVTIIGASLGGYLAPRAAAFEKRIKRVIAWSVFPNFLEIIIGTQPEKNQKVLKMLIKLNARWIINYLFYKKIKCGDEMIHWGLQHGMYAYEAKSPYDYLLKMNQYQIESIGNKIDQDLLIVGANKDHFINYKSISKEIDVLDNVKSLTFRLFTEKEDACNHCNCGNTKLVLDVFCNWIEQIKGTKK